MPAAREGSEAKVRDAEEYFCLNQNFFGALFRYESLSGYFLP
jgi:hypothetical protein